MFRRTQVLPVVARGRQLFLTALDGPQRRRDVIRSHGDPRHQILLPAFTFHSVYSFSQTDDDDKGNYLCKKVCFNLLICLIQVPHKVRNQTISAR